MFQIRVVLFLFTLVYASECANNTTTSAVEEEEFQLLEPEEHQESDEQQRQQQDYQTVVNQLLQQNLTNPNQIVVLINNEIPIMNLQRIADYHLTVSGLLANVENMSDYNRYFDKPLVEHTEYIFSRIRGYAYNTTEAFLWNNLAREFFRAYVINVAVMQARALFEAYRTCCATLEDETRRTPWSLLAQTIRVAGEQMSKMLCVDYNLTYPHITNAVLLYELALLTSLPVAVTSTNREPFLLIHLDAQHRRFLDKQSLQLNKPKPNSPLTNFENELQLIHRALAGIKYYSLVYSTHATYLKEYVDARLLNATAELLKRFLMERITDVTFVVERIMSYVFLEMLVNFLEKQYDWLICHPILSEWSQTRECINKILFSIKIDQHALTMTHRNGRILLEDRLKPMLLADVERTTQRFHRSRCITVGFSEYHKNGIFIVDAMSPADSTEKPLHKGSASNNTSF